MSLSEATTNPGNGSVTSVHINADDVWHMVIGGYDGSGSLSSVELFNWQTGVGCYTGKNCPIPNALNSCLIEVLSIN